MNLLRKSFKNFGSKVWDSCVAMLFRVSFPFVISSKDLASVSG